uniref:Uncharacterized protein n=1 Tax=Heliothis virescens TaxID=7102 RepID=A0A2A4JJE1_HELVI
MSTFDKLPVILVSAINETVATALMSDLIDNDVTSDYLKDTESLDRVWRLVNKYYTANVRVHPLADQGQLRVDPSNVEAHVIHLTEEETRMNSEYKWKCGPTRSPAARGADARAAQASAGQAPRLAAKRFRLLDGAQLLGVRVASRRVDSCQSGTALFLHGPWRTKSWYRQAEAIKQVRGEAGGE